MKLFHYSYIAYERTGEAKNIRIYGMTGVLWARSAGEVEAAVRRKAEKEQAIAIGEKLDIDQVDLALLLKDGAKFAWLEIKWAVINFFKSND